MSWQICFLEFVNTRHVSTKIWTQSRWTQLFGYVVWPSNIPHLRVMPIQNISPSKCYSVYNHISFYLTSQNTHACQHFTVPMICSYVNVRLEYFDLFSRYKRSLHTSIQLNICSSLTFHTQWRESPIKQSMYSYSTLFLIAFPQNPYSL